MDHLIIINALRSEARPFIDHFGLQKQMLENELFIYEGTDISCFTTGVGKANVKKRLTSLFENKDLSRSILVNVGIAGGKKEHSEIGKLYLVNKLTDEESARIWFPDMLLQIDLPELPLTTVAKGVTDGGNNFYGLVDMEGAAIFEASVQHLPVHQLHFLKVVSDHMDMVLDNPDYVEKLIADQLPKTIEIMELLQKNGLVKQPLLDEENKKLTERLNKQLKLTVTQQHQLKELVEGYIALNSDDISFLCPYLEIEINTTAGRQKAIKEIHETLSS